MPFNNTSTYASLIIDALYEPLVAAGEDLEMRAAESIDISEDGLVWTVHLNPEVVWSDGEPVTADDWVWTFQTITNPELGVTLIDEYTFEMRWKEATYLDEFAGTSAGHFIALPRHCLEDIPPVGASHQ